MIFKVFAPLSLAGSAASEGVGDASHKAQEDTKGSVMISPTRISAQYPNAERPGDETANPPKPSTVKLPWSRIERGFAQQEHQGRAKKRTGARQQKQGADEYQPSSHPLVHIFTQAPFAFDDLTAATMNLMPFTPSSMVGNATPSGAVFPSRAAFIASATSE